MAEQTSKKWALVFTDLDNIILNNYWRRFNTYKELGWDESSITEYLSKKKNIMKIASFNTTHVSFSASSRRNRYYNIYDTDKMLEQDVEFQGAKEGLAKLNQKYEIYVISSRKKNLQEKTLRVMKNLGFDLNMLTIFFMEPNAKLYHHKRNCVKKINEKYPTGVGICLNPNEKAIYERFGFTPVGFTSIKDYNEFTNGENPFNVICQNWPQLLSSLNAG